MIILLFICFIYISLVFLCSSSPYNTIADYLLRNDRKSKDFIRYTQKEVESSIENLANSQKAFKSMDGAAHMFNSAISKKRFYFFFHKNLHYCKYI